MNIKKIIVNYNCDKTLFSNNKFDIFEKLRYLIQKYSAILLNNKRISILGYDFVYDNRYTPALMQLYLGEISDLDKIIKISSVNSILEIRANIGQWSYAAKLYNPKLFIDSFEPNHDIFNLLSRNSKNFKNWRVFNYAISDKCENESLFYIEGKSSEGSFIKNKFRGGVYKRIPVKTIKLTRHDIMYLKLFKEYDLIKIDVEGSEAKVLAALENIKFRYLFIEVGYHKGVDLNQVMQLLKDKLHYKPELLNKNNDGQLLWDALIKV